MPRCECVIVIMHLTRTPTCIQEMGCAASTEWDIYMTPLETLFHDEVPLFLKRHCEIKTGTYVEWTTLVSAFDVHMSKHAVYIECRNHVPWKMITFLFNKSLHKNAFHVAMAANNVVTGMSLVSFPTPV